LHQEGVGDVSLMIEDVLGCVEAVRDAIASFVASGDLVHLVLRIIEYVDPENPIGPGFAIEPAGLRLLAGLGALVDVDLYAVRTVDE